MVGEEALSLLAELGELGLACREGAFRSSMTLREPADMIEGGFIW